MTTRSFRDFCKDMWRAYRAQATSRQRTVCGTCHQSKCAHDEEER